MRRVVVAIVAAAVGAAACSHSEDRGAAATTPGSAGSSRPAATARPTASAGPALVGHQRLESFLPKPDGWTLEHSAGADVQLPAPASHVRATYKRGAAQIDLELTDTGGDASYIEALSKIANGNYHQEAPNGYMKAVSLGGFPGVESFNRDDQIGEVTVILNRRFLVHASSSGATAIDSVRSVVTGIDLSGLAALK